VEPKPENTYHLPTGKPISQELRRWFRRQRRATLRQSQQWATLPSSFPPLTNYDDVMARAMTPILTGYWEEGGRRSRERVGLDPDSWEVHDPHLQGKIHSAALNFCKETNATTHLGLTEALGKLRSELEAGLVDAGDSVSELTKRVKRVFTGAETWRARRIAATEASRAVHASQVQSAKESGVVAGFEWLVSALSCPLCQQIATEVNKVALGQAFAVIGDHPSYSSVEHPPAHPSCRCSMVEILTPEYGGPEDPEFAATLDQPKPGDEYEPPEGQEVTQPKPGALKPRPLAPTFSGPLVSFATETAEPTLEQLSAAQDYGYDHWTKEQKPLLNRKERTPLEYYKGGEYRAINKQLRGLIPPTAEVMEEARAIDRVFVSGAVPVPSDLVVWRVVHPYGVLQTDDLAQLVGHDIGDKGFLSTSMTRGTYEGKGPLELKIKVPKGTPSIHLDCLPSQGLEHQGGGEMELIFQRGQGLRVTGTSTNQRGQTVLECTLIPPTKPQPLPKKPRKKDADATELVRPTKPPVLPIEHFGWTEPGEITITPPLEIA